MNILTRNDNIKIDRKNVSVSEIMYDKRSIMSLIRNGYMFDDDVLSQAGIKKIVSQPVTKFEVVEHERDNTVYQKDKESITKIIKSLEIAGENTYE